MDNHYHRHHSLNLKTNFKFSIPFFSHHSLNDAELCYHKHRILKPTPWRKKSPTANSPEPRRGRSHCLLPIFKHHRPTKSADFSYDPSSYALNFEDHTRSEDEEFPFRDFSSRLKASTSPPLPSPPSATFPKERPVTVDCRV